MEKKGKGQAFLLDLCPFVIIFILESQKNLDFLESK